MKTLLPWALVLILTAGWTFDRLSTPSTAEDAEENHHFVQQVSEDEKLLVFEEAELLEQLKESGRPYLPFLRRHSLSTGIYRLEAGIEDGQSPHELDEVYYTLSGKSKFEVEGETVDVKPGTILFVEAGATHKFKDITEDLELLVFFSTAKKE